MKKVAVILAGGRSSRFGSDKAAFLWQGRTLLDWAVQNARRAGFQTVVSGRKTDPFPYEGPLQALFGIWRDHRFSKVLLLACDMPLVKPEVLQKLWEEGRRFDVTVLRTPERISPLPGVYSGKAARLAGVLFAQGRRGLKSLMHAEGLSVREIRLSRGLTNINTPADFIDFIEQIGP